MRVLHGNQAVVRLRDIKIDDDQNITEDDNDPYPDMAGRSLHKYTPPAGSVPGSPREEFGAPELPNYRRSPLLWLLNNN